MFLIIPLSCLIKGQPLGASVTDQQSITASFEDMIASLKLQQGPDRRSIDRLKDELRAKADLEAAERQAACSRMLREENLF